MKKKKKVDVYVGMKMVCTIPWQEMWKTKTYHYS